MVRRVETETDPIDYDERVGEAIEAYLRLGEAGPAPDPVEFAARYPDLSNDLVAALEGLALVRGLVGEPGRDPRLESGRRIAGYRIVRELGRGGMGVVYEAVHLGLDRPVALKVLGSHAAPDSTGRRRFLNEARTAAGLHHTHIVPVFDVGQVGGLCYYAMQRIEGSGLDCVLRYLRRDRATAAGSSHGGSTPAPKPALTGLGNATGSWGSHGEGSVSATSRRDRDDESAPFEPPRGGAYYRWVAEVGCQAAAALDHAHRRGIIHRDVKPSNLLVDARGTVWIADFGLARRLADPSLTQNDSLLGTPRYMSPEQAQTGPIDGRVDIYSLGATLYELVTLHPPFEGQTAAELVDQIRSKEPASPRTHDPRIPRDLETILLKTLAKRPADRYATALDLADDLERFLHHEPVRARRISPVGRLWRFARRHPALTTVSTVAAATVLAVASVAYVRVVHERDQAIKARADAQDAMLRTETANRATQAAMRTQLWREASVVRLSNVPNRRVTGLGLLKEAAELGPEPALRTKLRNEAIEFLVLRDVEARPGFPIGRTRGLVFGLEGTRLASLSDDGEEFRLWNVERDERLTDQRLRPADPESASGATTGNHPGGGRRFGWGQPLLAAVGPNMAVVLPDGRGIRLFDAITGTPVRDFETPGRRIVALFAAPGDHRLVTVEIDATAPTTAPEPRSQDESRINLWGSEPIGEPIATLARWRNGPGGGLPSGPLVAISPDGKTIATARSRKTTISLWASDDGQSVGQIESQTELSALTLGPDGLLAAAGGGTIHLWDTTSRAPLPGLTSNQGFIRLIRFNPTGTLLALAGASTNIELWDPATNSLVAVLPTPEHVDDLTFSPDGRTLAAAGQQASTASVWAVVDPVARVRLSGFDSFPSSLAFRPDGLLAMGSRRGMIRFWKPGQCPGNIPVAERPADPPGVESIPDPPRSLIFDDRGRLLTLRSDELRLWPRPSLDSDLTAVAFPRQQSRRNPTTPMARTADGQVIYLARPSQLLVWRSDQPESVRPLPLPPLPERIAATADRPRDRGRGGMFGWRTLAVSPSGDRLYLLDGAGEVHALAIEGDTTRWVDWTYREVFSLALSPDGATLAVSERAGAVTLLETGRGTVRGRLHSSSGEGEGMLRSLAFAPNGRELAVGTQQGPIDLWSLNDLSAPRVRLPGHRGFVTALAYGVEGRYLASGGADKFIDIWDLDRIRTEMERLGLAW